MSEPPPKIAAFWMAATDWIRCPHCGSKKIHLEIGEDPINLSGDAHESAWFRCLSCDATSYEDATEGQR